jgi:hypothetical protein
MRSITPVRPRRWRPARAGAGCGAPGHFLPVQHAEAEADLLDSVLGSSDLAVGVA